MVAYISSQPSGRVVYCSGCRKAYDCVGESETRRLISFQCADCIAGKNKDTPGSADLTR